LLGWSPRVPLEQGLRSTIDYFSLKIFTEAASRAEPVRIRAATPSLRRRQARTRPGLVH
jgi:hypothetical protein